MSSASACMGSSRSPLFLNPDLLPRIRQHIASHELIDNLFSRLSHETERDLQQLLKSSGAENQHATSSTVRQIRWGAWYAELQDAHRVGRIISRLAVCHAVSGRPDLASGCVAQMREAAVRPTMWDNPMQDLVIAALARSFCVAYDLLYDSEWLGDESESDSVVASVKKRLLEMGDWLEYYLTKGGLGLRRNHDVIVACTLGLIALSLREDEISEEWASLVSDRLDTLLYADDRHLGEDGDWYESSLRYQFYILQWFHLFADACRSVGLRDYYAIPKTRRFFAALSHFITPDGHNLGFNDTSHDEVIMLGLWPLLKGAIEYQDAKLFCSLQRIIAKLPEIPLVAAEAMLALGQGDIPSESDAEGNAVVHFRRTGTVVARSDWSERASLFALECGPYVSHNHLGKGTFEYYYAGQPVILDTGCGHYMDRSRWIVPEMHNIVVVNGGYKPRYPHPLYGDQGWDFAPSFHGRVVEVKANQQMTFIKVDYAAFARTPKAIRNAWFVSPGYLLIEDRIEAVAGRNAEYNAFFHAHGSIRRKTTGRCAVVTTPEGMRVRLEILEPSQGHLSLGQHPFAIESIAAVKSGGEFRVPPRHIDTLDYLEIQTRGQVAWFLVALLPQRSQCNATNMKLHVVEELDDGHLLQVEVSEDVRDVWVFRRDGGPMTDGNTNVQTNGRVAFVRLVNEQPVSWFILKGKLLTYGGVPLIDSPVSTTFLSR